MRKDVLTPRGREIFPYLKNFKDFYLAGGTALALQINHRQSIDFDFFSDNKIKKSLLKKSKEVFDGREIKVLVNNIDELTILVDDVKITFMKYPFPNISNLIDFDEIKLLNIKEIASAKAYAIGRRGTLKDYIDLYFIIRDKYASLGEIIDIAIKKYKDEFNSRLFLEQLIYLGDIEDSKILFLKDGVSKEEIKDFFEKEIREYNIVN